MYIEKKITNQLYPLGEYLFKRKYAPCFCKIKPELFEVTFQTSYLNNIVFNVKDFDIEQIGLYASIGVGGEWWIYQDALVTLRQISNNSDILEFVDLAFFNLYKGWLWAIQDGQYTKDYRGKDDEEYLNRVIYPLQNY